ncbi:MAG TPA: YfhO family protein, partial [Patescibacteria group bacterium]|nr:YfhO family protein [Patescibacteria group bacterium]
GFNQTLLLKDKKKLYIILSVLTFLIGGLFIYVNIYSKVFNNEDLINGFLIAKRNIIIPLATIIVLSVLTFVLYLKKFLKPSIKEKVYIVLILAFSSFELFYYFQKITPFSPSEFLYPKTPVVEFLKKAGINRSWGYGLAYEESNFQTYDEIYSTEGNDPLHIKNYTELLAASKNGRFPEILPRPDANIAQGFGKEELAENPYRQKVLNITGVKYVLNKDEGIRGDFNPDYVTFPEKNYKLVWQNGFWQAYENLSVTPRFFVTNNFIVTKTPQKTLRKIFSENFDEQKQIVVAQNPRIKSGTATGSAKLISYSPNRVVISVKADKPELLFLSDNYYPGWRALVNGKISKIYLADYTFRAVIVPKGESTVVFEFKPEKFYHGLYISVLGILGVVTATLFLIRKNEK